MTPSARAGRKSIPALLAIGAPALLFALAGLRLLPRVGISFDEPLHREYGLRLWRYYASGGADRSFEQLLNLRYYGGLFDLAATLLERALGTLPWSAGRHGLSLACGALGVALAAAIAGRLGGRRAAWTAGLLLASTPAWFGHALFNPKDVPFALGYLAGVAALARWAEALPEPPPAAWLRLGFGAGLAMAIRTSGIALLGIAAFAAGLHLRRRLRAGVAPAELRAQARRILLGGALALGLALACGALFTPVLHRRPLANLTTIVLLQQDFSGPNRMLFAGELVRPSQVAHRYLPTWLGVTLPPATLLGLLLALPAGARAWRDGRVGEAGRAVGLATFVPLGWIVGRGVPLYDGNRHALFLVALLTVFAALALSAAWARWGGRRPRGAVLAAAFALCLAEPLVWIARAGPYAYTYFNPLSGGLARASHRFDADYWHLSGRAAAGQLDRLADGLPEGETLAVRSNISWKLVAPFLRPGSRVRPLGDDRAPADVELVATQRRRDREQLALGDDVLFAERVVEGQLPFHVVLDRRRPPGGAAAGNGEASRRRTVPLGTPPSAAADSHQLRR